MIAEGALTIAPYGFANQSITSVRIPSTVTSIGDGAFTSTAMEELVIPASVTSIGLFAFDVTPALTTYTYCGTASIVGTDLELKTRISVCTREPDAPIIGIATATGTTTATVTFTAPASDGGSTIISYTAYSYPGSITATITQAGSGTILVTGLSPATAYTFKITALNSIESSLASAASNSITTIGLENAPLFSSATSYDGQYTVQVTNYNPAFTYGVSTTAGTITIDSTGLVTVRNLNSKQSATITVTTSRTGYESGSATFTSQALEEVRIEPMIPVTKPRVTVANNVILCTLGSYSQTPTSSVFSLFVDGKHISTNFSAIGDLLPDWIIPWAPPSTITRTATLSSASWGMTDSYKGKVITCSTLAYANHATGLVLSQGITSR